MKRLLLVFLLLSLGFAQGFAALNAAGAPAGDEIRRLEQSWADAIASANYDQLEQLLAPEFNTVSVRRASITTLTRPDWLANLRRMKFKACTAEVVRVDVFEDTAVTTVDLTWTVDLGGQSPTDYFFITDTWIKRDGRWQVVRRHSSPYPKVPSAESTAPGK